MTPKEKAKELHNKFLDYSNDEYHECSLEWELIKNRFNNAKQCALIAVAEIIKEVTEELLDSSKNETYFMINQQFSYWQEVKSEIEKL